MTSTELPALVASEGPAGAWLRGRWQGSALARRTPPPDPAGGFWQEWSRELRRQASDDRLPLDLRSHLRERARRALSRASRPLPVSARFPRRALRERAPASLPPELERDAREAAGSAGLDLTRPIVAVDVERRPDTCEDAGAWLVSQGYAVVQMGRQPIVDLVVLVRAAFLICDSIAAQHVAYVTNTPTLLLNARDPFRGYPVRQDGVFVMSTPIDLDSGRALTWRERLREEYFRAGRHLGFRDTPAAGVLAAVREMHEGVTAGWREDASQVRFREEVIEAGVVLADRVRAVAEWGPDGGFLGDGRLAAWQAEAIAHERVA